MPRLVHAILCGGAGTRLWPWSRASYPKQFLRLTGETSMLAATAARLDGLAADVETIAFGAEEHRFLIAEELRRLGPRLREVVLEPAPRGTAPAAILAALRAEALHGPDMLVLLSPADHHIADPAAYRRALTVGMAFAEAGRLVVFGVRPDRIETGYGHILRGPPAGEGAADVVSFVEKPDAERAARLMAEGCLWNAGIFLFSARTMLALAGAERPDMVAAAQAALAGAGPDLGFLRLAAEPFLAIAEESVDHAIAERSPAATVVVGLDAGWSDVGSWAALKRLHDEDADGNIATGPVELFGSRGVFALSDGPLLVVHGLAGAVIAAHRDVVYVAAAGAAAEAKDVVAALKRRGRREASASDTDHRPWGRARTLNSGERFRVKELVIAAGAQLSLQSHLHRAEHWIVVKGTAQVTIGGETRLVHENQSVYVPEGARHRLENPGRIDLHIIEIQTGGYLEEDDIVRYEDRYGRE